MFNAEAKVNTGTVVNTAAGVNTGSGANAAAGADAEELLEPLQPRELRLRPLQHRRSLWKPRRDRLIDAAEHAAEQASHAVDDHRDDTEYLPAAP